MPLPYYTRFRDVFINFSPDSTDFSKFNSTCICYIMKMMYKEDVAICCISSARLPVACLIDIGSVGWLYEFVERLVAAQTMYNSS